MKKLLLAISLSLPLCVSAAGIPTIDIAAIAQMILDGVEQATRFKTQMEEAKNRLSEMKSQGDHYKDMVDGHFNFEDVLNNPTSNQFMALRNWKDIYNDSTGLAELRQEFGMFSDDPIVQRRYDNKLRQYNAQSKFHKASVERSEKMKDLLEQFDTATTPAAKDDIANALRFEQTQIQNDTKMMASLNDLMAESRLLEAGKAARKSTNTLLNEGFPRR